VTGRVVVAMVTARGGSVGFPGKNLASFLGRPLVAHAVRTAVAVRLVDRVVVSTDDDAIAAAARGEGAEVVGRPPELATADSRSADAVLHAAGVLGLADQAVLVLLQPTSPLRTPADVEECVRLHGNREAGSVVQMTAVTGHHPWKTCVVADGQVRPSHEWTDLESPRQRLPRVLRPTGGVYVVGAGTLRLHRRLVVPEVLAQVIPAARAIDVDTAQDLRAAAEWAQTMGWT
jgi:CMP-N-acetylneuraminic acid synthetase